MRGVVGRRLVRPRGLRSREARRHRHHPRPRHQLHADGERRQDAPPRRRARRGRSDLRPFPSRPGRFVRRARVRRLGDEQRRLQRPGDGVGAARARQRAAHLDAARRAAACSSSGRSWARTGWTPPTPPSTRATTSSICAATGTWPVTSRLFASLYNLTDERYADSASISSSTPVFSPGLPRTVTVGIEVKR